MAQKYTYQSMKEHITQRQCAVCLSERTLGDPSVAPASQWRFSHDQRGGIDKSTRTAVCSTHGGN